VWPHARTLDAAFDEVGRGREADRSSADDRDGERGEAIAAGGRGGEIEECHERAFHISMTVDA
jgi:hypothetical protein